jgi:hypothetical protein
VALRDILPGEELTHNWVTIDDGNYTMTCRCGAPVCRGLITGRDVAKERASAKIPATVLLGTFKKLSGRSTSKSDREFC